MFRMLLSMLLTLSIGFSVGQKEKTITKKKVMMMATDDDDRVSRDVQVDANVEDDMLELTITIDGEEQKFKVQIHNDEAMDALMEELKDLNVDIQLSGLLGHHPDDNDDHHDYMQFMHHPHPDKSGGYLGVQIQELDGQLADYFGAKDGGVLITEVIEDGPAKKAGLKAGDVIVSVAGEHVEKTGDLMKEVRSHEPESKVELNVIRKNRKRKMKVVLGEAPHVFDLGHGQKNKWMFFGDSHDFDDEDFDVHFDWNQKAPHSMMQKFKHHKDESYDELWKELKSLREEVEKLKKDS